MRVVEHVFDYTDRMMEVAISKAGEILVARVLWFWSVVTACVNNTLKIYWGE